MTVRTVSQHESFADHTYPSCLASACSQVPELLDIVFLSILRTFFARGQKGSATASYIFPRLPTLEFYTMENCYTSLKISKLKARDIRPVT
jgi:hypothetical protein